MVVKYKKVRIVDSGDDVIEVDRSRLCTVEDGHIVINGCSKIVQKRLDGDLENHAIYLPDQFDYILGEDKYGVLCLIPLKKT